MFERIVSCLQSCTLDKCHLVDPSGLFISELAVPSSPEQFRADRPLGALSDFVVEEFRSLLRQGREQQNFDPLIVAVNRLFSYDTVAKAVQALVHHPDEAIRLGALDCEMLITALRYHKLSIPAALLDAETALCGALCIPPCLTYELIVMANSEHEARTFFDGDEGRAEELFYLDHQNVERALVRAVTCAEGGVTLLAAYMDGCKRGIEPVRIARLFTQAAESHALAIDLMSRFYEGTEIRPADFAKFRVYLEGQNEKPGPSGLYSPGQHGLRMLVFGQALPDRVRLVEQHLEYFPSVDRPALIRIQRAVQRGESAGDLIIRRGVPDVVTAEVVQLMRQIVSDMEGHLGFVAKFLGLGSDITGTAGRGVSFLQAGIQSARAALARVLEFGNAGRPE